MIGMSGDPSTCTVRDEIDKEMDGSRIGTRLATLRL